jgi:hypothetical protein
VKQTFFIPTIPLRTLTVNRQSVKRWATDWTMGVLGCDSRRRLRIFLFTTASITALGPTQPPIQWVPGALNLGEKRPGREADHSPPSSAEVKNAWSYTSTPQYVFMAWCLVKHRDNFNFYLYPVVKVNSSNLLFTLCLTFNICFFIFVSHGFKGKFILNLSFRRPMCNFKF